MKKRYRCLRLRVVLQVRDDVSAYSAWHKVGGHWPGIQDPHNLVSTCLSTWLPSMLHELYVPITKCSSTQFPLSTLQIISSSLLPSLPKMQFGKYLHPGSLLWPLPGRGNCLFNVPIVPHTYNSSSKAEHLRGKGTIHNYAWTISRNQDVCLPFTSIMALYHAYSKIIFMCLDFPHPQKTISPSRANLVHLCIPRT